MQQQRHRERQRPKEPHKKEGIPPFERPVTEGIRQKPEDLKEKAQRLKEEVEKIREKTRQREQELEELLRQLEEKLREKEKPSFSAIEEWLEEVIIDPSFFFLPKRFEMLFQVLGGLKPKKVIIPTDFYNILSARSKKERTIEYIEEQEYYPALLEFIIQWETPTKVKRKETLRWISSADFWSLSSKFLAYKVVPASEYLSGYQEGRSDINPIDIKETTKVLGETAGRAFYEMVAVSEKTGRAIVSRTHAFVRLCRKLRISTYESYTDWKDNFRRRHGFKGKFLILVISAGAYGLSSIVSQMLPAPIQQMGPFIIGAIVYDD